MFRSRNIKTADSQYLLPGLVWHERGVVEVVITYPPRIASLILILAAITAPLKHADTSQSLKSSVIPNKIVKPTLSTAGVTGQRGQGFGLGRSRFES